MDVNKNLSYEFLVQIWFHSIPKENQVCSSLFLNKFLIRQKQVTAKFWKIFNVKEKIDVKEWTLKQILNLII